jgi:imidazolonepropionase-like amidohydrolase
MQSVLSDGLHREGLIASPTLVMMRGTSESLGRRPLLRILATLRIIPRPDYANSRASVRRLHEAGVPILAGSDANADPATPFSPPHGESLHTELGLLVDAGLTPVEALRAATSRAADAFGLTDRGAVEPGRRADLVLVDGDPTTDIRAAQRIKHVWAGGVRVR